MVGVRIIGAEAATLRSAVPEKESKGLTCARCCTFVRPPYRLAVLLTSALLACSALAQQPREATAPALPLASPANAPQIVPGPGPAGTDQQAMKEMARTVTRMAEMCEMMMKKEKAALPYLGAAALTLGSLLFAVLVLLVVLQVQWIIYWSRLLHTQRSGNALEA